MIIINAFLVISSSISSVAQVSKTTVLNDIKEKNSEIINNAISSYEFNQISLEQEQRELYISQKILNFTDQNNLLNKEYIEDIKDSIDNQSYCFSDEVLDSLYINNSNFTPCENEYFIGNKVFIYECVSSKNSLLNKETYNEINHPGDETTSKNISNVKIQKLSTNSYIDNKTNVYFNGTIDNVYFIGLILTKDMCVKIYNTLAFWINNIVDFYSNTKDNYVHQIVSTILSTIGTGVAAVAFEKIYTYFAGLIESILGLLESTIIGFIISLIVLYTLYILVKIFFAGLSEKGYAVGFKIYNLFKWEYFDGEIDSII